jgi:GTP cyclohydrolase II
MAKAGPIRGRARTDSAEEAVMVRLFDPETSDDNLWTQDAGPQPHEQMSEIACRVL